MTRLVLDTNVVVAGLLWLGPPRRLIDQAQGAFGSPGLLVRDALQKDPGTGD